MSKKKKKKQKVNKPQLSKLDKSLYTLLLMIFIVLIIILVYIIEQLRSFVFFSDPDAVAWTDRLTSLCFIPAFFVLIVTMFVFLEDRMSNKKAIFGNKKVDYRKYGYQYYPIFYKGYKPKRKMTEDRKKYIRFCVVAWLILFSICCGIGCFGIFGRTVLTKDGRVIEYSVFNNVKEEYQISDISKVVYSTYYNRGGRYTPDSYDYSIEIHVLNSDKTFSFDNESFKTTKNENISNSLTEMIRLKEYVYKNKIITFDIREELNVISDYHNFNEDEAEILHKLFEKEE
jgi:hypothetical protein